VKNYRIADCVTASIVRLVNYLLRRHGRNRYISEALTDKHVAVGVVGDGEQMRRHLVTSLATVLADDVRGVDGQTPVRVDDDAKQSGVRLSQPNREKSLQPRRVTKCNSVEQLRLAIFLLAPVYLGFELNSRGISTRLF